MKNKKNYLLSSMLIAALMSIPTYALAVDSVSLEAGTGNNTRLTRAGMQWNWNKKLIETENTSVSGYWDLTLAYWHGEKYKDDDERSQNIAAIGFIPTFRFQNNKGYGPYAEFGVGPHLLSELYNNNGRKLSTAFQFGSHIGIGYAFLNNWDVSLRYQHYSNASIKQPNDGVNFKVVRISYHF